jgi:hypothetical protein
MITITGISRQIYKFASIPWGTPVPLQGGILILAMGSPDYPQPLLIADAQSLRAEFQRHQEQAEKCGATLILMHFESNAEKREAARADLFAAYQTPAAPTE